MDLHYYLVIINSVFRECSAFKDPALSITTQQFFYEYILCRAKGHHGLVYLYEHRPEIIEVCECEDMGYSVQEYFLSSFQRSLSQQTINQTVINLCSQNHSLLKLLGFQKSEMGVDVIL